MSAGRKKTDTEAKGTPKGPHRPFPRVGLKQALDVPMKIKTLNGGEPWSSDQLANAFSMGLKANNFYYLTAAARDYGLTEGTSRTGMVSIAPLGTEILLAPNPQVEAQKKREAFLRIPIFKSVLEHYKGSNLPEMKYLGNTLEREFSLPPAFHEEFSRLFRENCEYLGISEGEAVGEGDTEGQREKPTKVVLGESKRQGKALKAFVIMPFTEKNLDRPKGFFSEVLRSLVTPAGVGAGFQVETASRQGSDIIQSTIINDLLDADLAIADLTDHNPNVLFELGLRMAEDKPVAIIKATGTGQIFDVDNMLRVYEYNANLWTSTIESDLPEMTKHIKAAWENRESKQSYIKILRRQD
jgi:hypothetical protein